VVTRGEQSVEHMPDRAGHAVDLRKEGLADEDDSRGPTVRARRERLMTSRVESGEDLGHSAGSGRRLQPGGHPLTPVASSGAPTGLLSGEPRWRR
jgi:hypothetical protein